MKYLFLSFLIPILLLYGGNDTDRYIITNFSLGYKSVVIDSEVRKVGDRFSLSSIIEWKDDLVLQVRDTKSGGICYFTSETFEVSRKHTYGNYGSRVVSTSVNAQDGEILADRALKYMLVYTLDGRDYEIELVRDMSIARLPEQLSLMSQKSNGDDKMLVVSDFRGFVRSLSTASVEAKNVLSLFPKYYVKGEDEYKMRSDYLCLVHQYTDEKFFEVDEYTYDDLKLFLSVKL